MTEYHLGIGAGEFVTTSKEEFDLILRFLKTLYKAGEIGYWTKIVEPVDVPEGK